MSDTEKPSWEYFALAMERVDELQQRLAQLEAQLATVTQERDEWKDKARWKHTHDDSLELELRQQLAEAHSHLEVQRTATYQAVEREHTAKKQLALAQKGQP